MSKAYICDRCGDAKEGGPEAHVFLESHVLKGTRGSSVLARHGDLCSGCTTEIKACIEQRPPRIAGRGMVGQ